jgi:type IV pilus assembly protein PilC
MAVYTCKLCSGDERIVVMDMDGDNVDSLRQSLEKQGYYVFNIKKKPLQFLWNAGSSQRKISQKELLNFNHELLVLIKSGLPILQALDAILEQPARGRLTELLIRVREDVKGGLSLSAALEQHGRAFPYLYVASVRAGERTGDLPQTVRRYCSYLKRAELVRKKIVSALFYPGILIGFAGIALSVLLIYVVPTFSKIYADSGSQMPLPTQLLISFSSGLKQAFPFLLLLAVAVYIALQAWIATPAGRYRRDMVLLKIPLIGDLLFQYALAGFTRTFGTLLGSGIPIVESLKMSAGTLNNVLLERRLFDVVRQVEEGGRLTAAMERVHLMPPLALRMLGVGEGTGSLEEMLLEISEYMESHVEDKVQLLTTAIEPAVMIIMGVVVGGIIIAMYLPIFKIAGTVGG